MNLAAYIKSLDGAAPASNLSAPLAGLWWVAKSGTTGGTKSDWDRAHKIVQDEDSRDAALVHAHLHRVEGDVGNAGYWYRQAGQPPATDSLQAEWERIAATLLRSTT